MRPDWWVRVTSGSIIRALLVATAISACSTVVFYGLGFAAIGAALLLATAIGIGLIVVAVTWRFLTRA